MARQLEMNRMDANLTYTTDAGIDSIRAGDPLVYVSKILIITLHTSWLMFFILNEFLIFVFDIFI